MSPMIDPLAVNHSTVALYREMMPQGRSHPAAHNTLFIGTPLASEADRNNLTDLGFKKNHQFVVATFDPADLVTAPAEYLAVLTDGLTNAIGLNGGRLWKKNRQSTSILLFADANVLLKMDATGCLIAQELKGSYSDHGYELARASLLMRAARKPGRAPVLSRLGALFTVVDITMLHAAFAAA